MIRVVDYDPAWPDHFERLKAGIWPDVRDVAIAMEHVGSTSVHGLAAKPIIDIDVIATATHLNETVQRLCRLGYQHLGNLGIPGREAFQSPIGPIEHHLYVCLETSPALRNHLAFRDLLRNDPEVCGSYARLKRDLARQYADSREEYNQAKTEFILSALARTGMAPNDIESVRRANVGRHLEEGKS